MENQTKEVEKQKKKLGDVVEKRKKRKKRGEKGR